MEHTDAHGHQIKYDPQHKDEIKQAVAHLRGMSFASAEKMFEQANSIHRVDFHAGSHSFTLVAESSNYRIEFKH